MTDEKKGAEVIGLPSSQSQPEDIVAGMSVAEGTRIARLHTLEAVKRAEKGGAYHDVPRLIASYNKIAKKYGGELISYTPPPLNPPQS